MVGEVVVTCFDAELLGEDLIVVPIRTKNSRVAPPAKKRTFFRFGNLTIEGFIKPITSTISESKKRTIKRSFIRIWHKCQRLYSRNLA